MTEANKETLITFGKVASLMLLAIVAIISAAGVWNAAALKAIGSFYGWVAGVNICAEGFGIYKLYKYLFSKK